MTKAEVTEIVKLAVAENAAHREEVVQEELDARYHDIKLLMKNYRKLKTHYLNANEDVASICCLRHKTHLMMDHVEKMLAAYKAICNADSNPEEMRRWDALRLRYLSEKKRTIIEIAEELGVDKRTFFRDIGRALEDLSVLLFGLEAIGTWRPKK